MILMVNHYEQMIIPIVQGGKCGESCFLVFDRTNRIISTGSIDGSETFIVVGTAVVVWEYELGWL